MRWVAYSKSAEMLLIIDKLPIEKYWKCFYTKMHIVKYWNTYDDEPNVEDWGLGGCREPAPSSWIYACTVSHPSRICRWNPNANINNLSTKQRQNPKRALWMQKDLGDAWCMIAPVWVCAFRSILESPRPRVSCCCTLAHPHPHELTLSWFALAHLATKKIQRGGSPWVRDT